MKANPNFDYLHEKVNAQRVTLLQGGTRCFVGNTLVNTLTGYKPIESISVGEYVYSYNKGRIESKKVVNKFLYKSEHSLHKLITLVLYNNQKITSTYEHKHLQSNGYVRAIDIGRRAMERGCKFTNEIHGEQSWQDSSNELQEGETGNYNEASDRRKRILQDNAFNKREVFDNKSPQNCCGNIFAKLRKQSGGKSHQQYKDRQPCWEFGVGNTQGEYSAHDETRAASVQQRFKKWHGKNYGGECFGGAKFIQTLCSYGKRLGEEIRNFYVPHERNIVPQELEANLICDADIKEVILHKYDGTVYDIEVEDNHNFLITESNYVTHNSGKTFATIYFLIDYCLLYTGMEIDIVRDTFTALKATAWKDFMDVLMSCNLYDERNHNKTDHTYTINGNLISYYGADTPDKIHGRSRDILWINEAHQFPQSTIDQLFPRTRYRIICDYNPALGQEHWLDTYIAKYPPLITTYRDNPHLPQTLIDEIERYRTKDPDYWKVFGEGERGANRQGQIFTHFQKVESLPVGKYFYGLDFGKTNDPTALVRCYLDGEKLYSEEVIYQTNLTSSEIVKLMKQGEVKTNDIIWADSAEPLMIREIKQAGFDIRAATKGAGSVSGGIDKLKSLDVLVTNNSKNIIRESQWYVWNMGKDGKPTNEPKDLHNHSMDAMRYAAQEIRPVIKRHRSVTSAPSR